MMRTIVVLNTKGGSGKTTIATNLSGYYATQGLVTVIKDFDPQNSSLEWIKHRPFSRPIIHAINGCNTGTSRATRTFQMRVPAETQRLIIDSPAGAELHKLSAIIRSADKIVIPVSSSAIDIRATASFLRELYSFIKLYPTSAKVGVVANRIQSDSSSFAAMQRIFGNLDIQFVATLSQSDTYVDAGEHGVSIFELTAPDSDKLRGEWIPLLDWIEEDKKPRFAQPILYAVSNG